MAPICPCPPTPPRSRPGSTCSRRSTEPVTLAPGRAGAVPTGIAIALPRRLGGAGAAALRPGPQARHHLRSTRPARSTATIAARSAYPDQSWRRAVHHHARHAHRPDGGGAATRPSPGTSGRASTTPPAAPAASAPPADGSLTDAATAARRCCSRSRRCSTSPSTPVDTPVQSQGDHRAPGHPAALSGTGAAAAGAGRHPEGRARARAAAIAWRGSAGASRSATSCARSASSRRRR